MTDKELLELAVKAAGIRIATDAVYSDEYGIETHEGWSWNPLTDDGDALRLAVKLRITVYPPEGENDDATVSYFYGGWITEPQRNDPYAATRRAIVRAAAEIGKAHD